MENKDMNELDMTQLDRINGGVFGEVSADSALLHRLGLLDEEFNCIEVTVDWKSCSEKVDGAWEKVGIVCNSSPTHSNEYYYQGQRITWDEARKIAKDKMIKGPKIGIPLPGQGQ